MPHPLLRMFVLMIFCQEAGDEMTTDTVRTAISEGAGQMQVLDCVELSAVERHTMRSLPL